MTYDEAIATLVHLADVAGGTAARDSIRIIQARIAALEEALLRKYREAGYSYQQADERDAALSRIEASIAEAKCLLRDLLEYEGITVLPSDWVVAAEDFLAQSPEEEPE